MRKWGSWSAKTLAAGALTLVICGPASAITCSERLQVCHRYCIKSMADKPACHDKCQEIQGQCLSTGCWESKITARQCGIVRQ